MTEFKVVIGDVKSGKSHQKVVAEADTKTFYNKKIGDKVKGEVLGLTGYEFEITGGSDNCGFPMRTDIEGSRRKRIFSTKTTGLNIKRKGMRKRKNFAGNTISERTAQINLKVTKYGTKKLEEKPAEETKPEEKAEEQAKPEQKEEKPKEEAKTEEKKEAPAEEAKTEKQEDPKAKEKPAEEKPKTEEKEAKELKEEKQ